MHIFHCLDLKKDKSNKKFPGFEDIYQIHIHENLHKTLENIYCTQILIQGRNHL